MVKTFESCIPPSPNLDKVTVSFDKWNNTDLFLTYFNFVVQGSTFCLMPIEYLQYNTCEYYVQ